MLLLILAVVFSLRTFGAGAFIPVAAPLPPSDPTAIHLDACRGETVAFQVAMAGPVAFPAIVSMGDLCGAGRIPHDSVRIYVQEPIAVASVHPPQGSMPPGFYYDRLTPLIYPASIQVTQRQHRALWVDVSVPRGTIPGDYVGVLIVRVGNVQITSWIRLHVHDIEISRPSIPFIVGFSEVKFKEAHRLDRWDSTQGMVLIEKYLQMADDHGISLALRGFLPWRGQWETYDRAFGPWIERSPFWLLPASPYFKADLGEPGDSLAVSTWFKEVESHWRARGWDLNKAVAWIHDEPRGQHPVTPATAARYRRIVEKAAPGINLLVTESVEDSAYVGGGNWIGSSGTKFYPQEMAGLKRDGRIEKAIWYQGYAEPGAPLEVIHARRPGFMAWGAISFKYRHTVDGQFVWSANNIDARDPINMADGSPGYRDGQGTGAWPTNPPSSSIRWKHIRWSQQFLALLEMAPPALADSICNALVQSALCAYYQPHPQLGESHYRPPRQDPRFTIDKVSDWEQRHEVWDKAARRLRRR